MQLFQNVSSAGVLSYFKMQLYGTEEDMMARRMKDTVINDCGKWNEDGLCQGMHNNV